MFGDVSDRLNRRFQLLRNSLLMTVFSGFRKSPRWRVQAIPLERRSKGIFSAKNIRCTPSWCPLNGDFVRKFVFAIRRFKSYFGWIGALFGAYLLDALHFDLARNTITTRRFGYLFQSWAVSMMTAGKLWLSPASHLWKWQNCGGYWGENETEKRTQLSDCAVFWENSLASKISSTQYSSTK